MKDIIIASVAGGLIGYSTNWLAIKMLFRPHNEVRIFGMRLPFTPGLIPKERFSIAKKVGETISMHLMSTDALVSAVFADETTKNFDRLMDGFLIKLRETHKTLGETFIELVGWDNEKLHKKIDATATKLAATAVKNEKLRAQLNLTITERILGFLKDDGIVNAFNTLRENAAGRDLSDYISENDLEFIKAEIRGKTPGIMSSIRNYVTYDFNFGLKLKFIVHKVIEENVGGFAGLFVNKDKVYQSIQDGLENYLGDEESQTALAEFIVAQIDKLLDSDASELLGKVPEGLLSRTSSKIQEIDGFDDRVDELVSKTLDSIMNDDLAVIISGIIKKFMDDAVDMEINILVAKIEERNLFDIKKYASRLFYHLIKKCSHYVFDSMDFNSMIEGQLNSFGVDEVEEIIMSVVKRELNLITYLGGLIGLLLGFVSALL